MAALEQLQSETTTTKDSSDDHLVCVVASSVVMGTGGSRARLRAECRLLACSDTGCPRSIGGDVWYSEYLSMRRDAGLVEIEEVEEHEPYRKHDNVGPFNHVMRRTPECCCSKLLVVNCRPPAV